MAYMCISGTGAGGEVVADAVQTPPGLSARTASRSPGARRGRLDDDVVAAGMAVGATGCGALRTGGWCAPKASATRRRSASIVEVVDDGGAVARRRARQRRGRCSARHRRCTRTEATRAFAQRWDDGAPGVGEVVAGSGHPQRVDAGRDRHQHVVGVGDAELVGEHAAPRASSRPNPKADRVPVAAVVEHLAVRPAPTLGAGAARDRPRHHDELPDAGR